MKASIPVIAAAVVAFATLVSTSDAGAQAAAEETSAGETAADDELSATERALGELSAAYEGLAGLLDQGSGEAVDRVQEDIENLGDWEYRIVNLASASPETLETELNSLGNERWEAYWVQPMADEVRVYLKRPSISYLSRVPLTSLVRLLTGGGE